jgi:hypothetical protein
MRKLLVITLVGALLLTAIPGAALAGDHRSGSDLAAGLVLGATAAVVGGVLLNAFSQPAIAPPVAYAPPPAVYAPAPPVVYAPPPPVVYAPVPPVVYAVPPVIYRPAPVVVHRYSAPPRYWEHGRYERGRGWDRH